jgi:hypothetical protein
VAHCHYRVGPHNSYLDLKHRNVFSPVEYKTVIRPDVLLLREGLPSPHAKFANNKFWSPAELKNQVLPGGFKMKWHNIGPGKVQLRLPVMQGGQEVFLCESYVKENASQEERRLAKFKSHMNLVAQGRYVRRGTL